MRDWVSRRRAVAAGVLVGMSVAGVLTATGALGAGAGAAVRPRYGVAIQAVFDRRGDPALVANFVPGGDLAQPHWRVCRPRQDCRRVAARDRGITPGPEPTGTRIIATATYRDHTYTASRTWHGRVRALSPPRRIGRLAVGHALRPVAGRWGGGWGDDGDQLGAEACRTRSAHGCRMLAGGELGCPDASSHRRLGGWFVGAYVFVFDARLAKQEACAGTGYDANADLPLWQRGPTVSRSGAVGQITGPPRPTVTIPRHARATAGRVPVVTVRCHIRCHVRVDVLDGHRGAGGGARFTGRRTITVPGQHLPPGTLHVAVHVDDGPAIERRVALG